MKLLADVNWLLIGSTDEYAELKKWIAHICRDVTNAACIDEICIYDICVGLRQKGYEVIAKTELDRPMCLHDAACSWTQDDEELWSSSCGLEWIFLDDGPKENDMNYCPKCGKKLREATTVTDTNGQHCIICGRQDDDYEGVIHKKGCPLEGK